MNNADYLSAKSKYEQASDSLRFVAKAQITNILLEHDGFIDLVDNNDEYIIKKPAIINYNNKWKIEVYRVSAYQGHIYLDTAENNQITLDEVTDTSDIVIICEALTEYDELIRNCVPTKEEIKKCLTNYDKPQANGLTECEAAADLYSMLEKIHNALDMGLLLRA